MGPEEIKKSITKLKELMAGIEKNDNYMCIDCHIRRMIEYVTFLKFEDGCGEEVEAIRNSVVNYYMNRLDIKEIINHLSKLIEILERKVH